MQNTQSTDRYFAPQTPRTHRLHQAHSETAGTKLILATIHDGKVHLVTALSVRSGGAQ